MALEHVPGRAVPLHAHHAPPSRTEPLVISTIEWQPTVPGIFTERELADYQAGRNAMLLEAARLTGLSIGVFEL